jgi:hypothetical protein
MGMLEVHAAPTEASAPADELLRLQTLVEAHEEAPGQTLEQTLTERENARSSECFRGLEEKRAPQESMAQPSSSNDRSDGHPGMLDRDQRSFPEPLPLDPSNTDHRPRFLDKGKTIFPRRLWSIFQSGKISSSEFVALVFLLDQIDGWPVLNRHWVRLTSQDWAEALGMSSRNARRIRDSLLEKRLIFRKKQGTGYLYTLPPEEERYLGTESRAGASLTGEALAAPLQEGFVYLAECSTGHFKIGKSTGPLERVQHFDTQMPVEVCLRHSFPADAYGTAEKRLHRRYAAHRVNGEWFDLPSSTVAQIESITAFANGAFHYSGE